MGRLCFFKGSGISIPEEESTKNSFFDFDSKSCCDTGSIISWDFRSGSGSALEDGKNVLSVSTEVVFSEEEVGGSESFL